MISVNLLCAGDRILTRKGTTLREVVTVYQSPRSDKVLVGVEDPATGEQKILHAKRSSFFTLACD